MSRGDAPGRVVGCVVAGGRSVRMGRDKAAIQLGEQTLLERAVETLSGLCPDVCIAGNEIRAPGSVPVVADRVPGLGPLGGVVAGLGFGARVGASCVLFLPVDMPLLPAGLLGVLLQGWRRALAAGARACCVEADGVAQPLVSLVHVQLREELDRALEGGEYRLRPALMEAARALTQDGPGEAFVQTSVHREPDAAGSFLGWVPGPAEFARRSLWFSNCNTPEQMEMAVRAMTGGGPDRGASAVGVAE